MKRITTYASFVFVLALMSGCGGRAGVTAPVITALATSFEPVDVAPNTTDFTLGTAPDSAHFTGGIVLTVGNPVAYRTGLYAWAILNQGTVGTIDFDNPASLVSFYAINLFGGTSVVDVFDQADVNVGSVTITGTDMMNNNSFVTLIPADFGAVAIGKLTVTNLSAGGNQVWIDDFSSLQPMP